MTILIGKHEYIDVSEIAYARVILGEGYESPVIYVAMKRGAEIYITRDTEEEVQAVFEKMFPSAGEVAGGNFRFTGNTNVEKAGMWNKDDGYFDAHGKEYHKL